MVDWGIICVDFVINRIKIISEMLIDIFVVLVIEKIIFDFLKWWNVIYSCCNFVYIVLYFFEFENK